MSMSASLFEQTMAPGSIFAGNVTDETGILPAIISFVCSAISTPA